MASFYGNTPTMKETLDALEPFFWAMAVFVVCVAIAPHLSPQPFSLKHPSLDFPTLEPSGDL